MKKGDKIYNPKKPKRLTKEIKEAVHADIYNFLAQYPLQMHRSKARRHFLEGLAKKFGFSYRQAFWYYERCLKLCKTTPAIQPEDAKRYILTELSKIISTKNTPSGVKVSALSVYGKISEVPERQVVEHKVDLETYEALLLELEKKRKEGNEDKRDGGL